MFGIASWNVLAKEYGRPQQFPWVDPTVLIWGTRSQALAAEYRCRAGSTAVFCLQEVDEEQWHRSVLENLGYTVVFARARLYLLFSAILSLFYLFHSLPQRTGNKSDGCMTAFSSQFEQVAEPIIVELDQLALSGSRYREFEITYI